MRHCSNHRDVSKVGCRFEINVLKLQDIFLVTTRWRSKQGVCSVTCGGGVANRVLYCAREAEGEEVVVEDSECSNFPKPTAVVSCNTHSCPAR